MNENLTSPPVTQARSETDEVYDEFWKDIVETDGALDLDKVKAELHDFHTVMEEVGKVYFEITGGQFSKLTTRSEHIIEAAQKYLGGNND